MLYKISLIYSMKLNNIYMESSKKAKYLFNSKSNLKGFTHKTYGPNKFEIPDTKRKLDAMNYEGLDDKGKISLTDGMDEFYEEIDPPGRSDWLWEHKESGQSYKNYLSEMINSPSKSSNTVYIQNLDEGLDVDSFLTDEMMEHLRSLLELYYPGIKTKINSEKVNFETLSVPSRKNTPYFQYNGSDTLQKLRQKIPKGGLLIIGLTTIDIYPREDWNFVFGLASKEYACGIFSFRRYYDEIAGNLGNNHPLFFQTVTKMAGRVMLHETGHLFALQHCIFFKCLMNGSNHMQENFKRSFEICPVCLRKLWANLKFDIIERFQNLADGLDKINSELSQQEIYWYRKRIKYLNSKINK